MSIYVKLSLFFCSSIEYVIIRIVNYIKDLGRLLLFFNIQRARGILCRRVQTFTFIRFL